MPTKNCADCQSEFHAEEIDLMGRKVCFQNYCEPCLQKQVESAEDTQAKKRQEARIDDFWSKVPPLYRNTEIERLNPVLAQTAMNWQYNPIGLGIRGESGSGKTRAAVLLLYRQRMAGHPVMFLKATDISRYGAEQFSANRELQNEVLRDIRYAQEVKLLLIDDLGKGRLSPAAEELLYDILDKRSERELPVIWTANATAAQLHSMMSEDRGDAIMRRLAEFSKVISV